MLVRSKIDRRFARFCRTGDPDALAFVFDRTASRLLHVALWLCRNRADADDLLQRTFLQAIALRARFEPGRAVLPWLMGLLSNQALKLRRERDRRAAALPVVERAIDPVAEAAANELAGMVREVRAKLSEPYRDVLELHLEQGLDAGEIAQRLGRPAGTVRTQLMRGLEMLRRKLPSGFVAGLAPVMHGGAAGDAVRTAVMLGAARATPVTAPVGTAVATIGGVLMAKKLLLLITVLAMSLIALQLWPQRLAPTPMPPGGAAPIAVASPQGSGAGAPPVQRRDVTPAAAAIDVDVPTSTPPRPPWPAGFVVVDAEDHPIADATVTLRDHTQTRVLDELHTDERGRADCTVAASTCFAAAAKPGFVGTAVTKLWRDAPQVAETRFVLQTPMALRGVVLRADGTPAAGACVAGEVVDFTASSGNRPVDPDAVTAGSDGRFALPVCRRTGYRLHGRLGRDATFDERVLVGDGEPAKVVLRFPGGITVAGLVVDANGAPAGGAAVKLWRVPDGEAAGWGSYSSEHVEAKADASGRFTVPVQRLARYQLLASQRGCANSSVKQVETTAVRPRAETCLRLLAFGCIRGRVLHADGTPFVGVAIGAQAETGQPMGLSWYPDRDAMFARVADADTAADGSFALAVHPGTNWTLLARPAPRSAISVRRRGVAPGSEIELRITEAELAGCVVHGSVRRRDGQPVGRYRVELLRDEGGGAISGGGAEAATDGERFTLAPLPLGMQYCVRVTPSDGGAAPARFGPFTTDRARIDCELVLPPWGQMRVRVLDAQGRPALGSWISCAPVSPWDRGGLGTSTPADGARDLRCAPGPCRLRVLHDSAVECEQDLVLQAGVNPEVTVRLPARR